MIRTARCRRRRYVHGSRSDSCAALGMNVLGISCITNLAAGISDETINHEEVMETGAKVADVFQNLLKRIIPKLVKNE